MYQVTFNMMYNDVQVSLQNSSGRVFDVQQHVQAAKHVLNPEDNPYAASSQILITANIDKLKSMDQVSDQASTKYNAISSILTESLTLINQAREIAVQASNSTLQQTDLDTLAVNIEQIFNSLISLANTQIDGEYLLGGFLSDSSPFDTTTGAYNGNNGQNMLELSPGLNVPNSIPGNQLFAPSTGTNVFTAVQDLMTGLQQGDINNIHNGLDNLKGATTTLSNGQVQVGGYMTVINTAQFIRQSMTLNYKTEQSNLIEGDFTELMSSLIAAQVAYDSAVAEASQILSRLDSGFLR